MMLNLDRIAKKKPTEMNMLKKNARNNKMTIQSLWFLGRKEAQSCILRGWGLKWYFAKLVGWERCGTSCIYMYKQHSIVNTGNFNADLKVLTHNRYSVLNGHFVHQIHPSSFKCFGKTGTIDFSSMKKKGMYFWH